MRPYTELGCPSANPVHVSVNTLSGPVPGYTVQNPTHLLARDSLTRREKLFWLETANILPSIFMVKKSWNCSTHLPHMPPSWNLINYRKTLQKYLRQNFTYCFSLYSSILSSSSSFPQLNPQVLLTDWNVTCTDHLFRGHSMFYTRHICSVDTACSTHATPHDHSKFLPAFLPGDLLCSALNPVFFLRRN